MAAKAIAIANNDVAYLSWHYDRKIPGCLGFAVERIDVGGGTVEVLPAWVGFRPDENPDWERGTTLKWPVQKFSWKDLTITRKRRYRYRVIPMVGTPGHLTRQDADAVETGDVMVNHELGSIDVYFNRGILSTQALTRSLPQSSTGRPDPTVLRERIDQPGDPLRERLAGELPKALMRLLERAADHGGKCLLALYELNDVALVQALLDHRERVEIILANAGDDDATNRAARQTLRDAGVHVYDRFLDDGHIGHNKFAVYIQNNEPRAVLTGSTNWTATGLCAQSNNAVVIESKQVARAYRDYWQRLATDQAQGAALRDANRVPGVDGPLANGRIKVWFSPNTPQKNKPKVNPPAPVDMQEVSQIVRGAKHGVLFLAFIPGQPGLLEDVYAAQRERPELFVRGALTDTEAAESFIDLYHREMPADGYADARVVPAAGIPDQFGAWMAELYKLGHAVIHDKIVVVDPFSPDCALILGSHNLGYKASYANDENMVMIRGVSDVTRAYAAHVLDVYDHYRWRYRVQQAFFEGNIDKAWSGLDDSDAWQDKYHRAGSSYRREESFWFGQQQL